MKINLKTNLKKNLMNNKKTICIQKEEIKEFNKDHKKHQKM